MAYGLNQLRFDLRKLKGLGLCSIEDTGSIAPARMQEPRLSGRTLRSWVSAG
jgi:hypothetical protein